MPRKLVLIVFLASVIVRLFSMAIVLPNNRILIGKFEYTNGYFLYVSKDKILYKLKPEICLSLLDSNGKKLTFNEIENTPDSCILPTQYKDIITLKQENITRFLPESDKTTIYTVTLHDSTYYEGYLEGNDNCHIFLLEENNKNLAIIEKSNIKDMRLSFLVDLDNVNNSQILNNGIPDISRKSTNASNKGFTHDVKMFLALNAEYPSGASVKAEMMKGSATYYGIGTALHMNKKNFLNSEEKYSALALYFNGAIPINYGRYYCLTMGLGGCVFIPPPQDDQGNKYLFGYYIMQGSQLRITKRLNLEFSSIFVTHSDKVTQKVRTIYYASLGLSYRLYTDELFNFLKLNN
jgi:hypothetical protein